MRGDELLDAVSRIVSLWEKANPSDDERTKRRGVGMSWAWEKVRRYRSFLDYALEERRRLGAELVRIEEEENRLESSRPPDRKDESYKTAVEAMLFERLEVIDRAQFPVECFFMFGKVLLDRIPIAIQVTFGQAQNFEPSHRTLWHPVKGLMAHAADRRIPAPPAGLLDQARSLEDTLTRFRDHVIVHPQSPRHGLISRYGPTGELDLMVGVHAAKESDLRSELLKNAPLVADMTLQIDAYLAAVLKWVEQCLSVQAAGS